MLLDPITTHQRRTDCSSRQGVSEFPNPTEGEQNTKSRNGIKRSDSRRKKARVLERSRRHRVGVAVDESPKDERRVARKRRSTTISKERLSISGHDSGISTASSQDSLARQKGSQRRRRSSARAAERALNQKACLIQATFRGYIGRAKFREQYLLKKLKEIQQRKLEELADIETQKKLELSKLAKGKSNSWLHISLM